MLCIFPQVGRCWPGNIIGWMDGPWDVGGGICTPYTNVPLRARRRGGHAFDTALVPLRFLEPERVDLVIVMEADPEAW